MHNLNASFPDGQVSADAMPQFHTAVPQHTEHDILTLERALREVESRVTPVWPLEDYVAVNPYWGWSDESFLYAARQLAAVSPATLFMSVSHYLQRYQRGDIRKSDINLAIDELVADGVPGSEGIDVNQVISYLQQQAPNDQVKPERRVVWTTAELLDRWGHSHWADVVDQEVGKHCAAYFDQTAAFWRAKEDNWPLYQAWRSAAILDYNFEIHGVGDFRQFVAQLPHDTNAALITLLHSLRVPNELWSPVLLTHAMAAKGWAAWAMYRQNNAQHRRDEAADLANLLAIRLAYDVALCNHHDFHVDWSSVVSKYTAVMTQLCREDVLRYALLKADEVAYRRELLVDVLADSPVANGDTSSEGHSDNPPPLAQMVFCIDVRSERIRRNLEAHSDDVETFGYAGFFGISMEYIRQADPRASARVPVLVSPAYRIYEGYEGAGRLASEAWITSELSQRFWRKAWKRFQASAASCFGFVEATGIAHGMLLALRAIDRWRHRRSADTGRHSRMGGEMQPGPMLPSSCDAAMNFSKQADVAESLLRGIGITAHFSRLVVLCGHGASTDNNPHHAALCCGACGGHAGDNNARFAVKLLNLSYIRAELASRGIVIPDEVLFVAASHDTTTDEIRFYDANQCNARQREDLQALMRIVDKAASDNRRERMATLQEPNAVDLTFRGRDWSEVRPEWGLAGCAAFIAGPRSMTRGRTFDGRTFLHSYDYTADTHLRQLEQIMTAPMIVAQWIVMQYYASTVDQPTFGSGSKTIHNPVGDFGILSGNGNDLQIGLGWESVHDGKDYRHQPLRLLSVVAAPRNAIDVVLARHPQVESLAINGWLELVAVERGRSYRYTQRRMWEELPGHSEFADDVPDSVSIESK
ncbi:MAG: DUF2309 domain-containing protein [Pirellulaceae bacterium]|nr:DUF2309 domain-containing protein [Planctomycetales bacterium]